jgi:hypothetical protein
VGCVPIFRQPARLDASHDNGAFFGYWRPFPGLHAREVKDNSLDLLDDHVYAQILEKSVPRKFRDLALLYNEAILREWYLKVSEYRAQDQTYQALQIFSHSFPKFDFVWQLEMDARFTGNVAKMLTSAGNWAKSQPRKNLWERNGRWFIPALWKDYVSFSAHVDGEFEDSGIGVLIHTPNSTLTHKVLYHPSKETGSGALVKKPN